MLAAPVVVLWMNERLCINYPLETKASQCRLRKARSYLNVVVVSCQTSCSLHQRTLAERPAANLSDLYLSAERQTPSAISMVAEEVEDRLVVAPRGELTTPDSKVPHSANEVQFPVILKSNTTKPFDFHVLISF